MGCRDRRHSRLRCCHRRLPIVWLARELAQSRLAHRGPARYLILAQAEEKTMRRAGAKMPAEATAVGAAVGLTLAERVATAPAEQAAGALVAWGPLLREAAA